MDTLPLQHSTKVKNEAIAKNSQIEDRWLSVDEICKYLGVGKDTVYKRIDKHGMPAHRMGRLWKFKKEQVDRWVEGGGAASNQQPSITRGDENGQ